MFRIIIKGKSHLQIAEADSLYELKDYWTWLEHNLLQLLEQMSKDSVYPFLVFFFTKRFTEKSNTNLDTLQDSEIASVIAPQQKRSQPMNSQPNGSSEEPNEKKEPTYDSSEESNEKKRSKR